jgi:hypothetical protein
MVESYPEMADSFWQEEQLEILLKKISRRTTCYRS